MELRIGTTCIRALILGLGHGWAASVPLGSLSLIQGSDLLSDFLNSNLKVSASPMTSVHTKFENHWLSLLNVLTYGFLDPQPFVVNKGQIKLEGVQQTDSSPTPTLESVLHLHWTLKDLHS